MEYIKANIKDIKRKTVFALIAMTVFVMSAALVYAKYVTEKDSKAVVNSNGFYFSSNYLTEVQNDEDYSEYIMYGWDGRTTKSFAFKIRNYDNPLLYNKENQDVSYHISYTVDSAHADDVDVILYKMVDGEYKEENLDGVLPGGEENYNFNDYKVTIKPKEGRNITGDLSVVIKAQTVDSPYDKTLSTKVTLQYTEYSNFISTKGFINKDPDDYAFEYSICTANAADLSEMENSYVISATRELHVWWDTRYVTLDRFDDRLEDSFKVIYMADGEVTNENMKDYKNVIIIDDDGIAHMNFEALPFSAFDMYFYKNKGVSDEAWTSLNDTDIVDAEVINS